MWTLIAANQSYVKNTFTCTLNVGAYLGTTSRRQTWRGRQSKEWPCCQPGEELHPRPPSEQPVETWNVVDVHSLLPCTILAGCGSVCIRSTAQRSTLDVGSCPSDGSRHSTSRSLHKMPTRDLGVNSGDKHSTSTEALSPCGSMTSKPTVAFLTTRVSCSGPSMIRRLCTRCQHGWLHGIFGAETHRCGCTSGLGNLPRILDCH